MPVNQFLPFAIDEDANVMTQTDYSALSARQSGFQLGVASSQQLNKVWRQASIISTVIAQFICDHQVSDVLDNGEIPTLVTQLEAAIQSFLGGNSTLVLPGTTVLWCAPVVPDGYLELAGQAISRTTYSALFALFGATYGAGDGSTTFNLPDLRGEFVRGWDHGRGVDSERTLGSTQSDAIQNITGSLKADVVDHGNTQFIDALQADGAFERIEGNKSYSGDNVGGSGQAWGASFDASRVVRTANETRSRNIALMYIIKI